MRSDLVAIPRVGFPPSEITTRQLHPIGMQSNVPAPGMVTFQPYSSVPNIVIPTQHGLVQQMSPVYPPVVIEGGSRALAFTRIEAIYI